MLGPSGSGLVSSRAFDHVLIIMFENQYRGYVLGNPYMRRLARQGIQLGNYFGVMHPSQTNYIASIAGELCDVTNDEQLPLLGQRNIVDLIEEAPGRLRWKAYLEGVYGELCSECGPVESRLLPQGWVTLSRQAQSLRFFLFDRAKPGAVAAH